MPEKIQLHYVDLDNGERLAYRKAGSGPKVLVLVHGNTGSSKHWELLMHAMPDEYTVYAPDQRGFGDSTYNRPADSIPAYADDLHRFVKALGLKSFSLSGWSFGGAVSMQFAATYPKRVERLILLASAGVKGYQPVNQGVLRRGSSSQKMTSREEIYNELRTMQRAIEKRTDWVIRTVLNMTLFSVTRPSRKMRDELIEVVFKQRNLIDVNYALARFNISRFHNGIQFGTGEVENITAPTLVLQGDRDLAVDLKTARSIVDSIGAHAELVHLEGCGHFPLIDNLEAVRKEYLDFLENPERVKSHRTGKVESGRFPILKQLRGAARRLRPLFPFEETP